MKISDCWFSSCSSSSTNTDSNMMSGHVDKEILADTKQWKNIDTEIITDKKQCENIDKEIMTDRKQCEEGKLNRQDYSNVMRVQMVTERLREAIGRRDRGMLDRALRDATDWGLAENDEDIRRAQNLIRLLDQKSRLQELLSASLPVRSDIQYELGNIEKSKFLMSHMQRDYQEAKLFLEGLERLCKVNNAILDMDKRTMSEVRRYHKAPPEVVDVMRATLLLLGEDELTTKQWKSCQKLMTPTGPEGMNKKIVDFNISELHPEVVARARQMLQAISLEVIQPMSKGVATFYVWAMSVVEEFERNKGNGAKPADIDLQRKIFGKPRRRQSPARKHTTLPQNRRRGVDVPGTLAEEDTDK